MFGYKISGERHFAADEYGFHGAIAVGILGAFGFDWVWGWVGNFLLFGGGFAGGVANAWHDDGGLEVVG